MEQFFEKYNNQSNAQELDLIELIQRVWVNKGLVIKVASVFVFLGLLVAIFSSKVYSASCEVVPQTSKKSASSSMSSLAALAGIELNQSQDVKALSPYVYENIIKSTAFRKELIKTPIDFKEADHPISFYEYYTSEEYNKPGVGDYILRYTIGLPGVIIGAIRGEVPVPDYGGVKSEGKSSIQTLSREEYNCLKILDGCIDIMLDDKDGYVTISANMPEPVAAAQLAQATVELLQKYITEFKIEKVQSNLDFVQERYNEAKSNFEDVQARRAKFRDANLNTTRYSARTEIEKLDAEYSLALNLYKELSTQLEQTKISVKETIPVLTVINPVTVPFKKSSPKRLMILFVYTFFGVFAGAGCVLLLPIVAEITGNDKFKRFIKELPKKEEAAA